jgi:hypothetical protein
MKAAVSVAHLKNLGCLLSVMKRILAVDVDQISTVVTSISGIIFIVKSLAAHIGQSGLLSLVGSEIRLSSRA